MRSLALLVVFGLLVACSPSEIPAGDDDTAAAPGGSDGADQPSAGNDEAAPAPSADEGIAGPHFPGAGGGAGGLAGGSMACLYPADGNSDSPGATMEWVLETDATGAQTAHARLTMSPYFVDNTYGVNSIDWGTRGHTWRDLLGSDCAEFVFRNGAGETVIDFKLDYIGIDPTAPSGYASLGVGGGDGKVISGSPTLVRQWMTSLARNLNERGYASYTTDSPATDETYTPNPAAPDWDYRVVYEVWVDLAGFGASGFGSVSIEYIHASPSKQGVNTVVVVAGDCPAGWCSQGNCGPTSDGSGSGTPAPPELCVADSDCVIGKHCLSGVCLPDIT